MGVDFSRAGRTNGFFSFFLERVWSAILSRSKGIYTEVVSWTNVE